jgi:hypothetical protein
VRKHFPEFFRPSDEEKAAIWAEAAFVFDTNVLLNQYRMSREQSLATMETLKAFKGRLFLPHQVGVEFHRHREEEIADQLNAFESVRKHLQKIPDEFKAKFSRHPCIPISAIINALRACAKKQIAQVTKSQEANQLNFFIHPDPILPELADIFGDFSEGPYTGAADDALNKKVEERVQQNMPPCRVAGGAKPTILPANNPHRGDGRVWFQIVKHAETTKKPIIFVTGDQQVNWWRTVKLGNGDRVIGPHFQLIRDIEATSGKRFLMYTQEDFLAEAPKYLGVPEQPQAIEEVKQIRERAEKEKDTVRGDEQKDEYIGMVTESMEKDADLVDEPKTSPLEESKDDEKAEPEMEEEP